jgi:hypothetical protein
MLHDGEWFRLYLSICLEKLKKIHQIPPIRTAGLSSDIEPGIITATLKFRSKKEILFLSFAS